MLLSVCGGGGRCYVASASCEWCMAGVAASSPSSARRRWGVHPVLLLRMHTHGHRGVPCVSTATTPCASRFAVLGHAGALLTLFRSLGCINRSL